jgi:hypothetical protein
MNDSGTELKDARRIYRVASQAENIRENDKNGATRINFSYAELYDFAFVYKDHWISPKELKAS